MNYPKECSIGNILLSPPWTNASGFLKSPPALARFCTYRTGGVVGKTILMTEEYGHEPPVFVEGEDGSFYNAEGLSGQGVGKFRQEMSTYFPNGFPKPYIQSCISKNSAEEFSELILQLIEICDGIGGNYGCPNVKGGMLVGQNPDLAYDYTSKGKKATGPKAFIAKLTPNVEDIVPVAKACADAGADAILAINTIAEIYINPYTGQPHLTFRKGGGKSGRNIFEIGLQIVGQIADMREKGGYKFKVGGVGGIDGSDKAKAYFQAGADFFQVGTHGFLDRPMEIKRKTNPGLETVKEFLERMEREIYGTA